MSELIELAFSMMSAGMAVSVWVIMICATISWYRREFGKRKH